MVSLTSPITVFPLEAVVVQGLADDTEADSSISKVTRLLRSTEACLFAVEDTDIARGNSPLLSTMASSFLS